MNRFVIGAAALAPFIAHAADDWVWFATAKNGTVYAYHSTRLKEGPNGLATIWVKETPKTPLPIWKNKQFPVYSHSVARYEASCDGQTSAVMSMSFYDKSGSVIETTGSLGGQAPVVPDSIGEEMLSVVCQLLPPK